MLTPPSGYTTAEDVERTVSVDETAATTSLTHTFTTFGIASGSVLHNDDDVAGAVGNDGAATGHHRAQDRVHVDGVVETGPDSVRTIVSSVS